MFFSTFNKKSTKKNTSKNLPKGLPVGTFPNNNDSDDSLGKTPRQPFVEDAEAEAQRRIKGRNTVVGAPAQNKFGTLDFLGEQKHRAVGRHVFFFWEDSGKNTCVICFFFLISFKGDSSIYPTGMN